METFVIIRTTIFKELARLDSLLYLLPTKERIVSWIHMAMKCAIDEPKERTYRQERVQRWSWLVLYQEWKLRVSRSFLCWCVDAVGSYTHCCITNNSQSRLKRHQDLENYQKYIWLSLVIQIDISQSEPKLKCKCDEILKGKTESGFCLIIEVCMKEI